VFNPELNELYARERQRDFLAEAAANARAQQASAPQPRQDAHLVARLGHWMPRLRQAAVSFILSPYHVRRRAGDAPAAGD
jgi:hypothetical protein